MARERADSPPPPIGVGTTEGTLEPKQEPATPAAVQQPPTTSAEMNVSKITDEQGRKPAAKLERYGGQGASVEAFIAQFETHAKYFQWKEEYRVFQLKNSLTGTAAQALWTGGENATDGTFLGRNYAQGGGERMSPFRSCARTYAASCTWRAHTKRDHSLNISA